MFQAITDCTAFWVAVSDRVHWCSAFLGLIGVDFVASFYQLHLFSGWINSLPGRMFPDKNNITIAELY